jgi:DNA mismatch endonuclease (patch repair protein)
MAKIRGKDTKPELALRKAVHALGARFRVHVRDIPGRPDLANKRAKVAVFVDGCFWHGCPRHYSRPRSRQEFWDAKLAYNRARRIEVKEALSGWTVIEVWECEVRSDAATPAARIAVCLAPVK